MLNDHFTNPSGTTAFEHAKPASSSAPRVVSGAEVRVLRD
jgi:hypothetical protein